MRVATSNEAIERHGRLAGGLGCLRPAVGFSHPSDVPRDPHLTLAEKRAILASWASDSSAVQDEPGLRWLLGTPAPVPFSEVRNALLALETARWGEARR